MSITVLYWTYRPGGFDLLVDGLKRQTYKDWELVVVDDCPGRDMTKYLEDNDMPLAYCGPSKKKQYPDTPFNQCNAINTGLLHASCDILLSYTDYQWIPCGALARWDEFYKGRNKTLVSGVGIDIGYTGGFDVGEESIFSPQFTGWDEELLHNSARFKRVYINDPSGVVVPNIMFGLAGPWELFYGAAPMELFEETNGIDERADGAGALPMFLPMKQAHELGYKFEVDMSNYCYMIDHKHWYVGNSKQWYVMRTASDNISFNTYDWEIPAPNTFNLIKDRPRKMTGWRS